MGIWDVLIVGAGTAGLSAGIYAARARRSTLILDRKRPGGQAATTEKMENYPGFPGSIGGRELMERFRAHAEEMGARIERAEVTALAEEGEGYAARTREGGVYRARSVILAPGSEPRRLGIPGEKELTGTGVSYCATCDAELYEGARVVVVGSGDTAVEEAAFIGRFAAEVIMLVVHDEGTLDCTRSIAEAALANPKLAWRWNTSILSVEGEGSVEAVRVKSLRTGEEERLPCDGVFVFVGTVPQTGFAAGFVALENGFIPTNDAMETSRPRVFAAGDARRKTLRQVVTAASDGAIAAFCVDKALTEIDEFARAVARAGERYLLYFYTPPVQRSLDLFPAAEGKAAELSLPLIKLDTFRYRGVAALYGVRDVPRLVRIENGNLTETIEIH
jgi:thioredoxin reductase (NADPH)